MFDGIFYEVRQALSESVFRLDLQESVNAPLIEETFQIGEIASDMVMYRQTHSGEGDRTTFSRGVGQSFGLRWQAKRDTALG